MLIASLLGASLGAAVKGATPDNAYKGFYTGVILPYPKEVRYTHDTGRLLNVKTGQVLADIAIDASATSPERAAAQDIAKRVSYLAGGRTLAISASATILTGRRLTSQSPIRKKRSVPTSVRIGFPLLSTFGKIRQNFIACLDFKCRYCERSKVTV